MVDHEDREYVERRPLVTKTVRKKGFEVISDPIYNKVVHPPPFATCSCVSHWHACDPATLRVAPCLLGAGAPRTDQRTNSDIGIRANTALSSGIVSEGRQFCLAHHTYTGAQHHRSSQLRATSGRCGFMPEARVSLH